MKLDVNGAETFVSTGGQAFDPAGEVLLFIHGSGQSHLTYVLQGRFFANRGWQVLTPDMPSHGLSKGALLTTIQDMADWYVALLDAAGVKVATVIGHSQGGLIALEMVRRHPERVKKMALIASSLAIQVNPALIDMAKSKPDAAISAMMDWGHGPTGHRHDNTMPGQSHLRYGSAIMGQNHDGALHADLSACAAYDEGKEAAETVKCPTLCILAEKDKMTPIKFGRMMAEAISSANCVVINGAGHMVTSEKPFEVNKALRDFFNT